jgi:hypothetical protein
MPYFLQIDKRENMLTWVPAVAPCIPSTKDLVVQKFISTSVNEMEREYIPRAVPGTQQKCRFRFVGGGEKVAV